MKPTIAITLGDPLGIGPEIIAKSLKDPSIKKLAHWVVIGGQGGYKNRPYKISPIQAGKLSWQFLREGVTGLQSGRYDALVTAPVSKTHLHQAGFQFPGQTEFLAHTFKAKKTAMMLASSRLRVVLVTIHIPISQVTKYLTPKLILEKIILTHQALKKDFGIKKPKIAVCGLNPHAGEGGLMGNEEKRIILPAIKKAQNKKINVSGPHPPDTVFYWASRGRYDVVICPYHDQGLIALKTLDFDEGVNTTLGLPIIRTSPDHGPAFDIVGQNKANPTSMKEAMKLAVKMWKNRQD